MRVEMVRQRVEQYERAVDAQKKTASNRLPVFSIMVRPERVELPTLRFVAGIHWAILHSLNQLHPSAFRAISDNPCDDAPDAANEKLLEILDVPTLVYWRF